MGVALKHLERTQNHPQLWRWLSNKDTSIFNLHFCRARIRPLLMTHPTRAIAPIILKDYLQIRPATSKRFVYFVYPSCTLCTLDQRDLLSCLPAGYVSVLSASNPFNFHWVNGLCTNDFIHSSDPQCTTNTFGNQRARYRAREECSVGWGMGRLQVGGKICIGNPLQDRDDRSLLREGKMHSAWGPNKAQQSIAA